jgi:hypothetical protein
MRLIGRVKRSVLAALATVGLLAAGAWAGGAFRTERAEPDARPRSRSASVPSERPDPAEIRIGDALAVNGQRMKLSAFTTPERPERVIELYMEAFRRRGLIPIAAADEEIGHVSGFDPEDGLQHFVSAIPERSGRVLVLLGAIDPRAFAAPRTVSDAAYPIPEGHRALLGYESTDGTVRSQSGQFVSTLPPAEVAKFYRARLAARGFVERTGSGPSFLAFVNGREQISVAVQSLDPKRGAAVFVTHTEGAP